MPKLPGPPRPVSQRLAAMVDVSGGPDACHPFTGARSKKRNGTSRGHLRLAGAGSPMVLAHVVALALKDSGEPVLVSDLVRYDDHGNRLYACHDCNARWGNCCNPDHLYWGTRDENENDRRRARREARQRETLDVGLT